MTLKFKKPKKIIKVCENIIQFNDFSILSLCRINGTNINNLLEEKLIGNQIKELTVKIIGKSFKLSLKSNNENIEKLINIPKRSVYGICYIRRNNYLPNPQEMLIIRNITKE